MASMAFIWWSPKWYFTKSNLAKWCIMKIVVTNPSSRSCSGFVPSLYLLSCGSVMIYSKCSMCAGSFDLSGALGSSYYDQGLDCISGTRSKQIQMLPSPLEKTSQTGYPEAEDRASILILWSRWSRRWTEMYFHSLQFSGQHSWANV